MRDDYIRGRFDQLLDDAREALSGRSHDVNTAEQARLQDAADALKAHIDAHPDDFTPRDIKAVEKLIEAIDDLDPDDDFAEESAEVAADLEALADDLEFDLGDMLEPPEEDAGEPPPIRVDLEGDVPAAFEDGDQRNRFVQYAISRVLDGSPGRSALHQQLQARNLLTAARLSLDLDLPSPEEPEEPKPTEPKPTEPKPTEPKPEPEPEPGSSEELFRVIMQVIGGGLPAQREFRKMLASLGVTSLEALVKVATGGEPAISPGAHLRDILVTAFPHRGARIPPVEALDKLVQVALDKINK